MSNTRPDPEDLSVHVRRGQASRADERSLLQAIARDPQLRVAHQVGLDFDHETVVRAGDEELILRAADAALARLAPPKTEHASRYRSSLMAAAVVLLGLLSVSGIGAALWAAGITPWHKRPARTATSTARPAHKSAARRVRPISAAPSAAAAVTETAPHEEPTVAADAVRRAPRVDPAMLFHDANAARREGALARAKQLYSELIRRAPSSEEAHVAHVSLGKLLLAQGQYAEGEREFRRYLRAGGGPLSEEALFNRAHSLFKLGHARDEAAAWRALLSAYPESVYAARAKERLINLTVADKRP